MKCLTSLFVLIAFSASLYAQPKQSFPVKFEAYRMQLSKQPLGANINLVKRVLNQQFSNLITGQTKNSIGNFAGLDLTDASVSFAGNVIFDSGSVLTIKAKGGITDGLVPIFKNSKLNKNISLDLQYNIMGLGKRKLSINTDSADQYERQIDKIEYEYNIKRLAITSYSDSFDLTTYKAKTKKILDSLDLLTETDAAKLAALRKEQGKTKFLYDSIGNALDRYDTLAELQILHNTTVQQLDKLSLQSSVEGFSLDWLSFAYKVTNNSFKTFSPSQPAASQVMDTFFVSHEARVQYSFYSWSPLKYHTIFFDAGLAFTYSDNFNSLDKVELSETAEYGASPGARTQVKKYDAYQGAYTKNIPGLSAYADLFYFLFPNNIAAVHINPEWVTQKGEKPVFNCYTGFLLAFKNQKDDSPVINAELYYKFLDFTKNTDTEYKLFERNSIGLRFTFPIQFKYK